MFISYTLMRRRWSSVCSQYCSTCGWYWTQVSRIYAAHFQFTEWFVSNSTSHIKWLM